MCGIAGIVRSGKGFLQPPEAAALVETMTSSIAHRGPDASGVWSDPAERCVLGHRRLSIIDTSPAGRQPMPNGDGRWMITFNGELYNFQEIRPALEAAGIRLRGRTDTEVLIDSIALWGDDAFARFDGMFAFGAFDTLSGELLLARDPFGEKPIYYMELPGGDFAFASELQALEKLPGFDGTVDIDAIAEVLSFQYIGAPRSIYRSVKKLPPGHWLRRDASGKITIGRYYQFKPGLSGFTDRPMSDLADELEEILTRSIRRRLIADVPLGAFLSGGVDSSTVCALVRRKLGIPLMTFSTGFSGAPESEHLTARTFAEHLGTDHHEEILAPDAADFLLHIGELLDEPNGDSSCLPTYLLSRFARRHVTVAVSGDGGDEMFGGYGRYFATLDDARQHQQGRLPGWTPGQTYFGSRILIADESHLADLLGFVPDGFANHVARVRAELNSADGNLLCKMRRSDVDNYMPGAVLAKVDRMSMQHSLEVRTPFLNVELARFAERLPDSVLLQNGQGKRVLREIAYRYLPRELIDLPKQGFGLPMSDWARTSLLDVATKLIEGDDGRLRSMFGDRGVQRFMRRQRTPGQFSAYQVWCVAMLESWLRHHPVKLPQIESKSIASYAHGKRAVAPLGAKTFLLLSQSLRAAPPTADTKLLAYPEADEQLTPSDIERLAPLNGATLLCLREELALDFGFAEFERLQQLGVARLIFPHPFDHDQVITMGVRSMKPAERIWSIARLWPHAVGVVSNRRLTKPLRPTPFSRTDSSMNVSAPIERIDRAADRDLSSSFMVFEGSRQLPPIQVSHQDIGTLGGGRYSVWNQQVIFSATKPERRYKLPYWVVPLNEQTEPHLQLVPRCSNEERARIPASVSRVEELLTRHAPASFTLKQGDRVVLCTHALSPGGAERQWIFLAHALSKAGYDVSVVVYRPLAGEYAHYLPLLADAGIRVVAASDIPLVEQVRICEGIPEAAELLKSGLVPEHAKLLRLTAAFAKISPKLVIAQLDEPNLLAGFAAHLCGAERVVLSFRNYNPTNFPYLDKAWYREAYRALSKSPRVLFSGNHELANRDYADWIGIASDRVALVPNVIDSQTFPRPSQELIRQTRSELELPDDAPVLLGAFRLSEEKDPLTFIEVCQKVAREMPNLRALLVGVGPMRTEIEERIAALGLERQIRLLGRRSDINVLMSIASAFLLTSLKEGMPNVLMEAQLLGLPIIATATSGTAGVVKSGETALLQPVGDAAALAQGCIQLLSDSKLSERMGRAGERHVRENYAPDLLVPRYLDLLQNGGAAFTDDKARPLGQDRLALLAAD